MAGKQIFFVAVGVVATTIALIGIWLPGVPTVPPLLIALWAFGRSSKRLYRGLEKIPVLRQALREAKAYEHHRSVTKRVKVISQVSAWGSVGLVAIVTQNVFIVTLVVIAAISCSLFMWMTATRQSDSVDEIDMITS